MLEVLPFVGEEGVGGRREESKIEGGEHEEGDDDCMSWGKVGHNIRDRERMRWVSAQGPEGGCKGVGNHAVWIRTFYLPLQHLYLAFT